jgi:hypothetical protein
MAALFYAIAYIVLGAQLLQVDAAMAGRVWVTAKCDCVKDDQIVGSYTAKLCASFDSGACGQVESMCASQYASQCYQRGGTVEPAGACMNSGDAC